ncbi:MAG: primosomal protein N' [Candidatus Magasanikbacteria bacterium]|nr:primosomal protein N' [Candidatus Magasanikbacteria bacterium]
MIAHVILAKRGTLHLAWFDYSVPIELEKIVAIGQLVVIPFRSKEDYGIIHSLDITPKTDLKLKALKSIVRPEPLIGPQQLAFLEEMSALYNTSLGLLVKMNLLPLQKRKLAAWVIQKREQQMSLKQPFTKPRIFLYSATAERKKYIGANIAPHGQTLILVPEVNDAETLLRSLTTAQRKKTGTITGEVSPKLFFALWQDVWSGKTNIIIGTRRALFLPFDNLATIIVDDEGNDNHKSFDLAPRFHTRDAATILAQHHAAVVHLTTHAPTVETYYFSQKKVYEVASKTFLPTIVQKYTLLDIKNDRRGGSWSAITRDLAEQLLSATKGTIFLFCHRRGTLGYVSCRDCKTVLTCPVCQESLAYHAASRTLECHHCGHHSPMITTCARCRGTNITMFGPGTEQVESEIKKLLPNDPRPIVVIDSDTPQKLSSAADHIIVGTKSAWSTLPWKKISLMAFIDADTPLFVPEYKTAERLWQVLTRSLFLLPEKTPLYIQTAHPEHTVFQGLARPDIFYTHELTERRLFQYPPYRFVLRLFTSGKNYALLKREMEQVEAALKRLTKNDSTVTITPASDMFPSFQRGLYWQTIIIKIGYAQYKKIIRQFLTAVPETWKVDPNPTTLLSL